MELTLYLKPGTREIIRWMRKLSKIEGGPKLRVFCKEFDQALKKNSLKNYSANIGLKKWVADNSSIPSF